MESVDSEVLLPPPVPLSGGGPTVPMAVSMEYPKAVVLLSGGLDSATAAACARRDGFEVNALSFDYGQRHRWELECAARVAESMRVPKHEVVRIDLRAFGGSALTADIPVPQADIPPTDASEIPTTYVPARNTIFLSFALAWAEVLGASDIFIGVNAVDYSGYPDCRPDYIEAYQKMARLATKAGVQGRELRIHTPLIDLTKSEIIRLGLELGVDYGETSSCYSPASGGIPCGRCDSCHIRLAGFRAAGAEDPLHYVGVSA